MNNNLTVIEQNEQLLVDSREVAEMIGKEHKEFLRTIHNHIQILESAKLRSQDFYIKDHYKTEGNNKSYIYYLLTRKGCDMVANKMNGTKGVLFTAHYVTRFEEMEKALKVKPSLIDTYLDMNEDERAIAYFTERKAKRELQEQLTLAEPKVEKYDRFLNTDGLMKIGQVAKAIGIKGMGQNNLFRFLRENKVLIDGTNKNAPYQKYVERGFFQVKTQETCVGIKTITLVTPKGADFIADLLMKHGHKREIAS
ncbi:antirepressor [Bacillus subtilis]|uniref:Rha family transcriptional regulator n=1 Tax=Bacillus subtilis TaxID=1423 RepID=UPI0008FAFE8A|nr:phage regulatory protein/antirepressor Ant [Bacillus subtilis subsp. subtilis]MED3441536.1 phage antirepressor KilAC domain-containing protein [Bacillus subtilis]UAW07961.1 antirepressor KilAC domain-containing protein [Bacillus phage BUCT082]MED3471954.1 phage antirepressor KilAC domain-containing protein [Bacillus subtilis]OIS59142.1 antirepressor [Bacillus subtilis]